MSLATWSLGRSEANLLGAIRNCVHRRCAYCARTASLFVSIVTAAMIYRRATMRVQVSAERNERLLTALPTWSKRAAPPLFSSDATLDAIRSSKYRLVRIIITSPALGAPIHPSLLPPTRAPFRGAPLSSIRLELSDCRGGRARGEAADSCSIRPVLSRPR
jgi:hypothetical protein